MVGTTDVQGASNGSASNGSASNGSAVTNRNHNGSTVDDKDSALEKIRLNPHKHQKSEYKTTWDDLLWGNIIYLGYLHLGGVYGLYLLFTGQCKISTVLMTLLLIHWGVLGITAGAHRLWCHRGYKATWQLKLILTFFNTIAHHNGIWYWVITHRVHHKYSDTDADPHNSGRGLFFSHLGWVMVKEHPLVTEKRAIIDMSDIHNDAFAMFQKKHYWLLTLSISVILPTFIMWYCFGESLSAAWHLGFCFRHCFILNDIFLINSFAHAIGTKPYDKSIRPVENRLLGLLAHGEGWHNYHHVFPWDYKAAELGNYRYNFSTGFIDFFAKIGWAYDLKTASNEFIQKRMARTGDFNLEYSEAKPDDLKKFENEKAEAPEEPKVVWGWNDPDNETMKKGATILHKSSTG